MNGVRRVARRWCTWRPFAVYSTASLPNFQIRSRACYALWEGPLLNWGMDRKPYPSDVSDDEWTFVAPYLTLMREVFNGLRWIIRTGAQRRMMPNDLPSGLAHLPAA